MAAPGVLIAAPASGSGKTVLTLGLLRALARRGVAVGSAKVGPDYIDPAFHAAATGRPCHNLDSWAMTPATLSSLAHRAGDGADLLVCEGVMGLFDGAQVPGDAPRDGSTAEIAALTGWPVVLVVGLEGFAASAAALVRGFAAHRPDVTIGGVIFNRAGSDRHCAMVRDAMARHLPDIPVLGCLPRLDPLQWPHRHLGLVQAGERPELTAFLDRAADAVSAHVTLDRLPGLARPGRLGGNTAVATPLPPLGSHIAIARDAAFGFLYPAVAEGWRAAGAEVSLFSPLADEPPDPRADAIFLPGGYPELHAGRLAAATRFMSALRDAARRGLAIYGECGGYMTLGQGLVDGQGRRHAMAGLLPLETSFEQRRRHLGYRRAAPLAEGVLGRPGQAYRGHEFHYATVLREQGEPLFAVANAAGDSLGAAGLRQGSVLGSFMHLIDNHGEAA